MVSGPDRPASDKIPSLSIFAIVMLAPLPFGSVGPIPIVTWCIVLGVALSLTSLCSLDRRHIVVLAGVATIICAYVLVIHEQVSLRPFFAASLADRVWETAANALDAKFEPSV